MARESTVSTASTLNPELPSELHDFFVAEYEKVRRFSQENPEMVPISARWLESMVRIASARARLLLHSRVMPEDAQYASKLLSDILEKAG